MMIGFSEISFELAFFPLMVLFIIGFWNMLNHVSDYSGFAKLFMSLCLSMLFLVVIHDTCVGPSSDVQTVITQPPSESALAPSQEPSEDFLRSMFPLVWLIFFIIGAVLLVVADDLPFMEKINCFMRAQKNQNTPSQRSEALRDKENEKRI